MRFLLVILSFASVLFSDVLPASAEVSRDDRPRVAIISAFEPEWDALVGFIDDSMRYQINGMTLVTGTMGGKPVVLMMSGISMVNAAMNTQLLLDRFNVTHIVFSGIAGGIDPHLSIGDVVVPDRWAEYLESVIARKKGRGYAPERFHEGPFLPNYGMLFPNGIQVGNASVAAAYRYWFPADSELLEAARKVGAELQLERCTRAVKCLEHTPKIVVGGSGISGTAFLDNAEYRQYLQKTFGASVVDMESAAVGHVAFANQVPFIAFRSLSDLAGGGSEANQMLTFMELAAANSAKVVRAFIKALP